MAILTLYSATEANVDIDIYKLSKKQEVGPLHYIIFKFVRYNVNKTAEVQGTYS